MSTRRFLRARRDDLEMSSLLLLSYVPLHRLRLLALTVWGATLGTDSVVYHGLEVRKAKQLTIGERTIVGNNCVLDARGGLTIGSDVNFSTAVNVWTAQHDWQSADFAYEAAPVVIGDHAWLSTRVTVLPGSVIGEGAVVAAGALVTGAVPPWTLVGGVPAKVLGQRPMDLTYRLPPRHKKAWLW